MAGFWATVPSVQAQTPANSGNSSWGLGAGVVGFDKPYRGYKRETLALPLISYENQWVSISSAAADVKLYQSDALSFRLRSRYTYALDGYSADDSYFLAGMGKRKSSLWAGGALIWRTGFANFTGEFLADTMGNSKGLRASLQMDRRFSYGDFGFTPRIVTEWVDDKYVNYYYGVRGSEATTMRHFYEGKSTTNLQGGLRVDYTHARHHSFFLDLSVTRFGSTIKDSPLVDQSSQALIGLGYLYRY